MHKPIQLLQTFISRCITTHVMTKRVLEAVARNSLLEAARQRQQLGALFCENQFRYIVMSRLSNDGTFGKVGYSSDGQVTKALILELNYRTNLTNPNPSQIDLASIKKDSRGDYDNPRYQPQPLAVETKIRYDSTGLKKDLNDCRSYLRKNGSMRFQYAMLLVAGTRKPTQINPKKSTNSKLLYGYLDRDLNPVIYWAAH